MALNKTELSFIGFVVPIRLIDGSVRSTWDTTVTCHDKPMTAYFDQDPRFIALCIPSKAHMSLIPLSNVTLIIPKAANV